MDGGYADVRVLLRHPGRFAPITDVPRSWTLVRGDLAEPYAWAQHLEGADAVLHLAASTGKVPRDEHFRVITTGTRNLVQAARTASVKRFLFVSSVAAGFRNRRFYHYADAKLAAEAEVRTSGMDWLIVRPTMVLAPDSPVLAGLRKLAMLPVPVVFGDGDNPVQPVAVNDLAAILVAALAERHWGGLCLTVGGPETITTGELLRRIRALAQGATGRSLHLPLWPIATLLGVLEPLLFPVLPFTAGQLATFANPSVGEPSSLLDRLPRPSTTLSHMLGEGRT